jgi:hypothetical protein
MLSYVIAKYIRLSVEDGLSESMSIPHQRLLLDREIDELNIPNATVMEFVDNGHTGTDLERPEMQELLELVRCGKVNCIIVKDFSRFSRNALESGYYVEQVFPLYRVRFITVSQDHASASNPDINERKPSVVPYGYKLAGDGSWEVDDEVAGVVKNIFDMYLQGFSVTVIRNKLCEAGYLTPFEYFNQTRGYRFQAKSKWSVGTIYTMIKNVQYTGVYIAGVKSFTTKGRRNKIPKNEWIVMPDKHPPIISKEIFNEAQKIRMKGRRNMNKRNYLLQGKASCGCCGYALVYGNPTTVAKYRCIHTLADKSAECHKMNVNAVELEEAVMAIIKKQAAVVLESDDLTGLQKKSDLELMIAGCEEQIRQWVEQRQNNYERFVRNEIDRDAHTQLKNECAEQLERLNQQLAILKQSECDKQESTRAAEYAKEALDKTASPRDIVDILIDKVLVFPGNRLEISWKFVNFAVGL